MLQMALQTLLNVRRIYKIYLFIFLGGPINVARNFYLSLALNADFVFVSFVAQFQSVVTFG